MMDTEKNSHKGGTMLNVAGFILAVTICLLLSLCFESQVGDVVPNLEQQEQSVPSEQDTSQSAGMLPHKS